MKIATWNVNSISARMASVTKWLETETPDIVCLQELKCTEDKFPFKPLKELGYDAVMRGQKSYNGVAILVRALPYSLVSDELPGNSDDTQARFVEITAKNVNIASIYLPNGNPVESDKFAYKLDWMARLHRLAAERLGSEKAVILAGDYNVIPHDHDCWDINAWRDDALARSESRQAFRKLLNLGYVEALNSVDPRPGNYTFWDYQKGRWNRDEGIRIDHFLLSPQAADRMSGCYVDRKPRGWEKASDHTPVILELDDA